MIALHFDPSRRNRIANGAGVQTQEVNQLCKQFDMMKPIMQAILANWYWHYFQQNRWRFMRRTATAEPPSDDFTTWDLPRILARIDEQFARRPFGEDVAGPDKGLRK